MCSDKRVSLRPIHKISVSITTNGPNFIHVFIIFMYSHSHSHSHSQFSDKYNTRNILENTGIHNKPNVPIHQHSDKTQNFCTQPTTAHFSNILLESMCGTTWMKCICCRSFDRDSCSFILYWIFNVFSIYAYTHRINKYTLPQHSVFTSNNDYYSKQYQLNYT